MESVYKLRNVLSAQVINFYLNSALLSYFIMDNRLLIKRVGPI